MSTDMFPDSFIRYMLESEEDERPWVTCRDKRCEHAHLGEHEHRAGLADLEIPERGQE